MKPIETMLRQYLSAYHFKDQIGMATIEGHIIEYIRTVTKRAYLAGKREMGYIPTRTYL